MNLASLVRRLVRPSRILSALIVIPLAIAAGVAGAQETRYRVGPGDTLSVSIFGYDDISGEQVVREDGRIALHLLGTIDVAGRTVPEVEAEVAKRASETFQSEPSVVVGMTRYRDVFVSGEVTTPGAYEFRPGLTVVKAVALAGGTPRAVAAGAADEQRILEAQRRAAQAEVQVANETARIEAMDADLARLEGEPAGGAEVEAADGPEAELVAMRRALLTRSVEQAERQARLAEQEAESMQQRRLLIQNQREATAEQLERMEELADRGLSRREQLLDLQIAADNYRADELESSAFEARALQTAANAESQVEIEHTRYRQDLLADRIAAEENRALALAEYRASVAFLRSAGQAVSALTGAEETEPIYEIIRGAGEDAESIRAELTTPLSPDDVLIVRTPVPDLAAE